MTHILIKPRRDVDFYVVWSSVADGPLDWGPMADLEPSSPRQQSPSAAEMMLDIMAGRTPAPQKQPMPLEAFAVADEHGSCTRGLQAGWFDYGSKETLLYAGEDDCPSIDREDFPSFIDGLVQQEEAENRSRAEKEADA